MKLKNLTARKLCDKVTCKKCEKALKGEIFYMKNIKNTLKIEAKPMQNPELVENAKSNLIIEVDNYWWSLSASAANYLKETAKNYIWPTERLVEWGLEPDIDDIKNTKDENLKLEKVIKYVKNRIEEKGLQKFYGTIPVTSIKEIEDYINAKDQEAKRRARKARQESAECILKNTNRLNEIADGTLRVLINQLIASSLDNATMNEIVNILGLNLVQEQSAEVPVFTKADLAKCLANTVDLVGLLAAVNKVIAEVEEIVDKDRPAACYNTQIAFEILQSITNREVNWYVGGAIGFEKEKLNSVYKEIFATCDRSLFDMFVSAVYNRLLSENLIVTEAEKQNVGITRKISITKPKTISNR